MKPISSPASWASDTVGRRRAFAARALLATLVGAVLTAPASAQPGDTTLYRFGLGYAPSGAIVTSQDSVNGGWSYSYDAVDRLVGATAPGRAFSYDYDRNGNRWRQNPLFGPGPSRQYGVDSSSNRILGLSYDALGNLLSDGVHTYIYDAENRLIRVDNGATAAYAYDAFGRRARKAITGGTTEYVYDLDGHAIAARDPVSGAWRSAEVYLGDRHLATYARGTTYLHHQDWLGSSRLTTLFDGTVTETCTDVPFGDAVACSQASGQEPTSAPFADYPRDAETQLDHTWYRQYSSAQGRWTSPDPFLGSIDTTDPQSLNRYAYVTNDPVRLRDPLGLLLYEGCIWDDGTVDDSPEDGGASKAQCEAQGGTWGWIDTVEGSVPRVDPVPIPPPFYWGRIPPLGTEGGGGGGVVTQSTPFLPALAAVCQKAGKIKPGFANALFVTGGFQVGGQIARGEPLGILDWINLIGPIVIEPPAAPLLLTGVFLGHEWEIYKPGGKGLQDPRESWSLVMGVGAAKCIESSRPGCAKTDDCPNSFMGHR